ncbi:MAG: GntR family transcriptional regulator [Casimicrobiaceae bacterium]
MTIKTRIPNRGDPDRRKAPGMTRTDAIRMALERDIVSGALRPGTKLDEDTLGASFGASRTPVREALRLLASKRLIEIRAHAGAYVSTLSIVDLAEMFEAMALLEAGCASLAARRHDAHDRKAIAAAHEACTSAARSNDPGAFYGANAHFHERIYAASHNGYLVAQTIDLGNRLEAYRREATYHPGLMSVTINEHEHIMMAIFEMDEAAASRNMRSHIDTLRNDIVSMATAATRQPAIEASSGLSTEIDAGALLSRAE